MTMSVLARNEFTIYLSRKAIIKFTNAAKRCYATAKVKIFPELRPDIKEKLESKEIGYRHHPGKMLPRRVEVPLHISDAVTACLKEANSPMKNIVQDSMTLYNYIKSRHSPVPQKEVDKTRERIEKQLNENQPLSTEGLPGAIAQNLQIKRQRLIYKKLRANVYVWKAIEYTEYESIKYLYARGITDYAVLYKLFCEIKKYTDFVPTSYFDFGSGLGTGLWAATECWGEEQMKEYYMVDVSSDIHQLARTLMNKMYKNRIPDNKFFQRQFMPVSNKSYDLVVSAYSLFELSTPKNRLQTLLNLWKKTKDFLVIVEYGSNAGFNLVCEARDFILDFKEENLVGHVFSPCSHDLRCPRFLNDIKPCNFRIHYHHKSFLDKYVERSELYSYVIMRKGKRPEEDSYNWPRIVRRVLHSGKKSICRMCCNDGTLKELMITKRACGTTLNILARKSEWGDKFPVGINTLAESAETVVDDDYESGDESDNVQEDPEKVV